MSAERFRDSPGNLNAAANSLATLPVEIGRLERLERLVLWSNQLTHVPPEIARLRGLRGLSLCHNPLGAQEKARLRTAFPQADLKLDPC